MEAKKSTINDIFNQNRILEIPFFQRAYVWDNPEWERFLADMEDVSHKNKPYFLGSVILKQQPTSAGQSVGDKRTVIDGQQRLTTLNIFFKVLSLKLGNQYLSTLFRLPLNNNEIALLHNHNDIEAFKKVMSLDAEEKLHAEDNISRAYSYFREKINTTNLNFQNILTNIMFVGIDLGIEEDEQQIFDTINSLGIRLTTAELLKNYFFLRSDLVLFKEYWQDVFEKDAETKKFWDIEINAGRYKRNFIDLFFYSFLQIKIQDNKLNVKTEDKDEFTKVDGLFNSYKRFIKDYNINRQDIITEIREYAKVFQDNFDMSILDEELPANSGIERINALIFGLENTTLISYVLFVLKNVSDKQERDKIFDYLESYIMRRMVCHSNTKNYNQLFSERFISNNLVTLDDLKTFIDKRSDKVNFMPSDNELREGFHKSKLTNKQSAGVLYFIESKIRNRNTYSTSLLGLDRYSLEHIMPKKWESKWNKLATEEEKIHRNRKLLTLGNLTIITSSLNSSISNGDWNIKRSGTDKKPGLKKYASGLETFSQYLDLPEWNEQTIEARANYLYSEALKIWQYGVQGTVTAATIGEQKEPMQGTIEFENAPSRKGQLAPAKNVEGQTENNNFSGEAELIKAIQSSKKDAAWWNKYFDTIQDMLKEFKIDENSPKISMSVTKSNKMPVTIGQRYVIYASARKNKVGMILPIEFEEVLADYKSVIDISGFSNGKGEEEALWVRFDSNMIFSDDPVLLKNWKNAIKFEIDRTKVSGFRKFHNDYYFKAVVDLEYRKQLLAKN